MSEATASNAEEEDEVDEALSDGEPELCRTEEPLGSSLQDTSSLFMKLVSTATQQNSTADQKAE